MRQSYDLEMSLGESYIEGLAIGIDREYKINIQGGATCLILPIDFERAEHAVVGFATISGNKQKIEIKVEYDKEWIQVYDDNLTAALSDLPISMKIVGI